MGAKSLSVHLTVAALLLTALGGTAYAATPQSSRSGNAGQERQCGGNGAHADRIIGCDGVRPGASISFADGTGGACTMNFLFKGSDGMTYVGTGGHCIFDGEGLRGQRTWRPGKGIETYDADGDRIGETAFWILDDDRMFDFGLIRLDPSIEWDARMCYFGGPTGIYSGVSSEPAIINFFGNQSAVGEAAPARKFVATTGLPHRDRVDAMGVAFFGDSGGPATLDDGKALGVVVSTGFGFSGLPGQPDFTAGNVFIVRLPRQVKAATNALGIDFKVLKAPLA